MTPISRFWTWTGTICLPLIIGWVVIVTHAFDSASDGQTFTRAYFGLLISLAYLTVILWTWILYLRTAANDRSALAVPINTLFEDKHDRHSVLGWGTAIVFFATGTAGAIVFAVIYGRSQVHLWGKSDAIAEGFWASRLKAFTIKCADEPCFTIAWSSSADGKSSNAMQYFTYLTDGLIVVLIVLLVIGAIKFPYRTLRRPIETTSFLDVS